MALPTSEVVVRPKMFSHEFESRNTLPTADWVMSDYSYVREVAIKGCHTVRRCTERAVRLETCAAEGAAILMCLHEQLYVCKRFVRTTKLIPNYVFWN